MYHINSHNIHRINIEQCLVEATGQNNDYFHNWDTPSVFSSMEQYQEAAARNLEKIRQAEEDALMRLSISRSRSDSSSPVTDTSSYNSSLKGSFESVTFGNMTSVGVVGNIAESLIYQVQFKHNFRDYTTQPGDPIRINIGSFVVVKCEFGEDVGVVTNIQPMSTFIANRTFRGPSHDSEENNVGVILRIATLAQRQFLPVKLKKEVKAMKTALRLAHEVYNLQMRIIGVEYQADMRKLTIHYVSENHVDFRELVKDLFSLYRVRIWMKKSNQCAVFIPKKFAVASLTTGISFEDNWEKNMY